MKSRHAVRVLSSFIYGDEAIPHQRMGRDNRWFHGFTKGLLKNGLNLSSLDIRFVRAPFTQGAMSNIAAEFKSENVRLVICPGTDAVIRWKRANVSIATLYFGAHPENNGLELLEQPNIGGVRLNLPLIWSMKNFSLLKELMPRLQRIYIPINLTSEFAFPNVRVNYAIFRRLNRGFWIPGHETYIGHRSVTALADAIGCQYFEGPYSDLTELTKGLAEIPLNWQSAIVGFNDSALMNGSVNVFLETSAINDLPLFWINNASIVRTGGVADFSSDFQKIGYLLGEMAARLLAAGTKSQEISFAPDPGELFTLNLARCQQLGITVTEQLASRFHRVVR